MASEHSTKGDRTRYVTRSADDPKTAGAAHATPTDENPHSTPVLEWEQEDGRHDPEQRFAIYCHGVCDSCEGLGKQRNARGIPTADRCPGCRGEGRTRTLAATCGTAEAVGVALVTLGREGEWTDCLGLGILDRQGEPGQKWILKGWTPSPRNVSDAGRVLRKQRYTD